LWGAAVGAALAILSVVAGSVTGQSVYASTILALPILIVVFVLWPWIEQRLKGRWGIAGRIVGGTIAIGLLTVLTLVVPAWNQRGAERDSLRIAVASLRDSIHRLDEFVSSQTETIARLHQSLIDQSGRDNDENRRRSIRERAQRLLNESAPLRDRLCNAYSWPDSALIKPVEGWHKRLVLFVRSATRNSLWEPERCNEGYGAEHCSMSSYSKELCMLDGGARTLRKIIDVTP
jgi:hypothetical protein